MRAKYATKSSNTKTQIPDHTEMPRYIMDRERREVIPREDTRSDSHKHNGSQGNPNAHRDLNANHTTRTPTLACKSYFLLIQQSQVASYVHCMPDIRRDHRLPSQITSETSD